MWNFERKWAKNNFLICRALLGNGAVWVCLQGGGDADWVSCWLSWLTMWLNQGIVDRFGWWLGMFSLGLGVQWVGWLYFDLMVRGGCVTGWLGMGLSQSVCGAGWVLVRSVDCVCVGGEGVLLTELDYIDDDLVCVHWGWVCNELDDYILIVVGGDWVTGWGMGVSQSVCVVLAGCWLGQWIVCV